MESSKISLSAAAALTVVVVIAIGYLSPAPTTKKSPGETGAAGDDEFLTVRVFFSNGNLDPEMSGEKVFAVQRRIPKTSAVARGALEELLKGPTDDEAARNYVTNINPGVKIQRLVIENGVAKVDFDEQLEYQVGGACRVTAIRAQITQTLRQFPSVNEVIISVNGRTEDILQP